jgi:hypothetical protein
VVGKIIEYFRSNFDQHEKLPFPNIGRYYNCHVHQAPSAIVTALVVVVAIGVMTVMFSLPL